MKPKTKKVLTLWSIIGLGGLGFLNACFSPDLAKARLLCDGVTRFCPESYACVSGLCVNSGAINDSPDLTISVPADLAGADLMPSPDMAITPAIGCKDPLSGGTNVSNLNGDLGTVQAYTCPGTFQASSDSTKNASSLCAVGYHICDYGETKTKYSLGTVPCAYVKGYFFIDVKGTWVTTDSNAVCNASPTKPDEFPGFGSCGRKYPTIGDVFFPGTCDGITFFLASQPGNGLAVNAPYNILAATNTNPGNGVTCCKNW